MKPPETEILTRQASLGDAARSVDATGRPVLILDDVGGLLGCVSDHELRTAELQSVPPGASIETVMDRNPPAARDAEEARGLLSAGHASHVVGVDPDTGRPVGVWRRGELLPDERLLERAILMVGGEGSRLRPLTDDLPKPLLPVGGVPILERIVRFLAGHGVARVTMALGYRAEQIEAHFGDGAALGVAIDYVREEKPLGTAGAVGLVEGLGERPLLVMNGDLLTDLDLGAMALAHRRERAAITMAARAYHHPVPYGVLKLVERRVASIEEKPTARWWTNGGIYLMDPSVVEAIPAGTYLDMTVLMERLIADGERVTAFPIREAWCDIGLPEDYDRANRDWS